MVFNPAYSGEALQIADRVRSEYVIAVSGKVVKRDEETVNKNLPTGEIEVQITEIEVLNAAKRRHSSLKMVWKLMSPFA